MMALVTPSKALKTPEIVTINQTWTKNSSDVTIIKNIRSTSQCISASTKECSSTDLSLVCGQKWKRTTRERNARQMTAAATVHVYIINIWHI
jgi:hypothetical protein